jgi:ribosomal protein L33
MEDGRIVGGEVWQEKYITERNGRSSSERQEIVAFCTYQWNE